MMSPALRPRSALAYSAICLSEKATLGLASTGTRSVAALYAIASEALSTVHLADCEAEVLVRGGLARRVGDRWRSSPAQPWLTLWVVAFVVEASVGWGGVTVRENPAIGFCYTWLEKAAESLCCVAQQVERGAWQRFRRTVSPTARRCCARPPCGPRRSALPC